ncbi:MAG: hypothetical protein WBD86_01325 [Microgenomates group bacterium]
MKNLIKQFEKARKDFLETIDSFPKPRVEEVLFDEWSLKNILSHLSGWAKYQTDTLRLFRKGDKIEVQKNLKHSINEDFVFRREKWSWGRVYQEFLKLSGDLIKEYESLPKELWENEIYNGKETTVEDFIKIEINHYNKTHGPQISRVLEK